MRRPPASRISGLTFLLACGGDPSRRTETPADTPALAAPASSSAALPASPQASWRTFDGEGYSVRYPPDGRVGPDTAHPTGLVGVAIVGPHREDPDREREGLGGPAYWLLVSSFENPARRSLDAWVDSVRRAQTSPWDAESGENTDPGPPDTMDVAKERALRLRPWCGDCEPYEIYLARGDQIVVLSLLYDISIPGDREAQRRLYDAILSTFRWDEAR